MVRRIVWCLRLHHSAGGSLHSKRRSIWHKPAPLLGCGEITLARQRNDCLTAKGQRAVGTPIKTHTTVAAHKHHMLHHRGGIPRTSVLRGTRGPLCSKKMDAQADSHRNLQRGRLSKTTWDRGAQICSHAAPTESIRSNKSRLVKVYGEPVSRSATQPEGARVLGPL